LLEFYGLDQEIWRFLLNFTCTFFFRYFGAITIWYLQSHLTWDKLSHSCTDS